MDDIIKRKMDVYDGICREMEAKGQAQVIDLKWAQYWEVRELSSHPGAFIFFLLPNNKNANIYMCV
jgi:hypothetical protein